MDNKGIKSTPIVEGALLQYLGSGMQIISGFIFYLFILRIYNASDVGVISLFIAIIGLFTVIFSFGLGTTAQHFMSYSIGQGNEDIFVITIKKIFVYGFLCSFVGLLSLYFISPFISLIFLHSSKFTTLIKLLTLVVFGSIFYAILNGIIIGLQNFRLSAISNIITWGLYYFTAILLVNFSHDLTFLVLGWILGIFSGVIINASFLAKLLIKKNYDTNKKLSHNTSLTLLKYTIPLFLSSTVNYGSLYVDRFVVAGLLNNASLGIYNFGDQ